MSASSKKKLRAETNGNKLTEKQIAEQKEAKKLKIYTIVFVVALVALVVTAVSVGINRYITGSGVRERSTAAFTMDNHTVSNADLSYYFIDGVNQFYSQNGAYAPYLGLDLSKALDKQFYDEEAGTTWADYFIDSAKQQAIASYALADAAAAEGVTISAEGQAAVDSIVGNMEAYAAIYGYADVNSYLKAYYGRGANEESFRGYYTRNTIASEYYENHKASLTYSDEEIRAAEKDCYDDYSSVTYNQYYITTSRFLTGGTTDEDGNTVYSEAEKSASIAAAEDAAKSVIADSVTSVEAFDAAIAAITANEDTTVAASSTAYNNQLFTSVNSYVKEWLNDASRVEGDKTYVATTATSTDDNGNETEAVTGYYVVYFIGKSENKMELVNARHILVQFDGGSEDESGATVYSAEDKAAAKAAADELLAQWKTGEATEASFAALADKNTDDTGSVGKGGLYENIYPGQMVAAFNDWCFDPARQAGDTDVVETEYGYHVMYFCGNSGITYRDYMITQKLSNADLEKWYTDLISAPSVTDGSTEYMRTDIVLQAAE